MTKIKWGVLSTAKIAREKVIPGMQSGEHCEIIAIASSNREKASAIAKDLNIVKVHDSYEELLSDNEVEAVYIPLPNHLHIEWALRAIEADKHVLCEKPIALSSKDVERLIAAAEHKPNLKIMEAFMYRLHPQWQKAKDLVLSGDIGKVVNIHSYFSYFNVDPNNIRNNRDFGGGAMMDIGCYCLSLSRFIYGEEPDKVLGHIDRDPVFNTDRHASGILSFGNRTASFSCSTQSAPYQRVNIIGTEGRIEIEIPFNAPNNEPTKLWLHKKEETREIEFDIVDQYGIQGDLFSRSIKDDSPVPTPLTDALNNMKLMEAFFKSADTQQWVNLQ